MARSIKFFSALIVFFSILRLPARGVVEDGKRPGDAGWQPDRAGVRRVSPSSAMKQTAVDDLRAGADQSTTVALPSTRHTAAGAPARTDAASAPSTPGRRHDQLSAAEGTPEENAARKYQNE